MTDARTSKQEIARQLREWYESGWIRGNTLKQKQAELLWAAIGSLTADEPSPRQDIARKLEEIRERAQFRGWADIGTSAVEDREFLLSYIYRLENQERPAEPPTDALTLEQLTAAIAYMGCDTDREYTPEAFARDLFAAARQSSTKSAAPSNEETK